MSEVYSIVDLEGYADVVRTEAASSYSCESNESLDDYISLSQVISIIEFCSLGFDENDNNIIDQDCHSTIVDETANWIFNVGLAKLAANNKLECAWDDDINSMVFWLPSDTENKNDTTANTTPKNGNRQD